LRSSEAGMQPDGQVTSLSLVPAAGESSGKVILTPVARQRIGWRGSDGNVVVSLGGEPATGSLVHRPRRGFGCLLGLRRVLLCGADLPGDGPYTLLALYRQKRRSGLAVQRRFTPGRSMMNWLV
jgi:hypothetical protein